MGRDATQAATFSFSPTRDLRAFNLGKSAKIESSPQTDVAKSIAEKAKISAAVIWLMERARTKKEKKEKRKKRRW